MITMESVTAFVNECLTYAGQIPANARVFEAQAYGAVMFAIRTIFTENPQLELDLIEKWDEEWHNLFTQIYLES